MMRQLGNLKVPLQTRTAELQEAESMYGLAICRPRCGIVYVGLEILDDPDRTADAMYASAWVDVSARVAVLWTWRMVSNKAGQRLRTHG